MPSLPVDKPKLIVPLLLMAVAIVAPLLLRSNYHRDLLVLILIWGIAALSIDIVLGMMGQFPFGHGALWGLGAYTSSVLTQRFGQPVWLGVIAAITVCAAIGFVLGFLGLRRLRGMEFALINFAFAAVAFVVVSISREISGGPTGLHGIQPPVILGRELRSEFAFYPLALGALLLSIYFVYRFTASRSGKAVMSARENEELAKSVGIHVLKYFVLAFLISAGLVGFSGALYAHHTGFVNPFLLHSRFILFFVVMVLIGGSGTLWGPVVGAAIFVGASELMRFDESLRFMFFGAFLLLAVLFMRRGAIPALSNLFESTRVKRGPRYYGRNASAGPR